MADVNIQQTPTQPAATSGGGSGAIWAILVVVLLAIIAWFVFGGGLNRSSTTKIEVSTPGASAPAPSGGTGGAKKP